MRFQCPFCRGIVAVENSDLGIDVQCGYCGEVVTVPYSRVATGSVIADFIILEELGRGGMGIVYLTHQISLDRPAALKILSDTYANNAEFVVNFIREARSAAKLNHPHIVQAYAVGEDEGIFYFAMEFIDGETMKSVLKRDKIIEVDRAITIIQQIAEALDYAWKEQRLVHRDIKPDNIMLTKNNRAKLADLGLSRVADEIDDSESDEVMGTPQYISPEHLTGAPMDNRSDIYSLGATFFHLITGRFPFEGKSASEIARKHLDAKLVSPSEINPEIPEFVSKIVIKMMEKNIKDRYQDASELVEDLRMARRNRQPSTASGRITGVFTVKKGGSKTGVFIKNKTGKIEISTKTGMIRTETTSLRPDSYIDPVTTQVEVQISKLRNLVISIVVILVLLFSAAGFFAWKMMKKRIDVKPAATTAAQPVSPKSSSSLPVDQQSKEISLYARKALELINFIGKNPDKEAEFLTKADEFFALYSNPVTDEEIKKYEDLTRLYIPIDEKLRVSTIRKNLNDAQLAFFDAKKAEDDKKAAADKLKAEQEKKKRDELAKKTAEENAKKNQLKKKLDAYVESLNKQKNAMRVEFMNDLKKKDFASASFVFNMALTEPSKLKGASADEQKAAADYVQWAKNFQAAVAEAEKVYKILHSSGTELAGKQIEIKTVQGESVLGSISGIKDANVTIKSMIDDRVLTVNLRDFDQVSLSKLLKRAAEKLNVPGAPFYYALAVSDFNRASSCEPDDFWKAELPELAFNFFVSKLKSASAAEKDALQKKYSSHPDYIRALKAAAQ